MLFFASNLRSLRRSLVGSLFLSEEQKTKQNNNNKQTKTKIRRKKKLACDVFDTFDTHAGRVYDVADTVCRAQNGSTYGRNFETLGR